MRIGPGPGSRLADVILAGTQNEMQRKRDEQAKRLAERRLALEAAQTGIQGAAALGGLARTAGDVYGAFVTSPQALAQEEWKAGLTDARTAEANAIARSRAATDAQRLSAELTNPLMSAAGRELAGLMSKKAIRDSEALPTTPQEILNIDQEIMTKGVSPTLQRRKEQIAKFPQMTAPTHVKDPYALAEDLRERISPHINQPDIDDALSLLRAYASQAGAAIPAAVSPKDPTWIDKVLSVIGSAGTPMMQFRESPMQRHGATMRGIRTEASREAEELNRILRMLNEGAASRLPPNATPIR